MTLKFLNQRSTQTVERKQKDGSKVTISCPDAVVAYKYMGGVLLTRNIAHADPCGQSIKKNTWSMNKDGARTLQYSSLEESYF